MPIFRIEHPVPDFDMWKRVFDEDPVQREKSGVRRYALSRPVDDANYIAVDLEFDTREEAEAFLARLRELWAGPGGRVSSEQQARILESVETRDY